MKKSPPVKKKQEKKAGPGKAKSGSSQFSAGMKKIIYALSLVVIVWGASLYSVKNNRQLEMMGGMAEEYLTLGVNMYYSGNFYLADSAKTPFVFRPPGYVKYLDLVITASGQMKPKGYQFHSKEEFDEVKNKVLHAIYLSQCLLIAASALVLFLLLCEFSGLLTAFLIALMFGINPYLIMLAGMVHYETLHIFMMLLSTWVMYLGFSRKKRGLVFLALSGVLWGLTTLVRPVSLIMPAIFAIAALLFFGRNLKSALLFFAIFTIAFVGTIAPYTYRNYKLTHRFVPVNAQSNISFWAGSHISLNLDANHYRWWQIWYPDGQAAYEKITGARGFETAMYADHVFEFEDLYKEKFRENLTSHPMTYAGNVCKNFLLLNFGMNSVFIKMFQWLQHNNGEISKDWLSSGNPQDFSPGGASSAFSFLMLLMSVLSIAGIFLALRSGDKLVYIPLLVFLTIVISHSITYMDLMYYYIRIPFLFLFTAYFIRYLDVVFPRANTLQIQRITTAGLVMFMFMLFMTVIA